MTLNNILVATDFSDTSQNAFKQALLFAERFGATLHVLHVVDNMDASWYGIEDAKERATALRKAIKQQAGQMLHEMVPDNPDVEVNTHVSMQLSFDVSATIREYAEERGMDLIVIGARGQTDRSPHALGRVASEVIEEAPCPVLTAAETPPWVTGREPLDEIVAPVDFSPHSHQAYLHARHIAAAFDAVLHLVFVAESRTVPVFSDTGLPGLKQMDMPKEIVENSRAALQHMIDHADGPSVQHEIHIEKGQPAAVVLDFIERKGMDLAVIATRGQSALKRLLLGSTTRRLLRMASCPVMTLRATSTDGDA
ncbi:MAG: universal stress protein [Longimonas sp.]|uniref:universal stress protein n=1 Tax=Longimonas sp. TaxID=2039626 RepID=UPI00334949C3